jgi:general secretion pathway protein A
MATDYLSFFNLSDNPFRLTPDISYFYNSPAHATALLSLEYCVTQQEGFCILTGEPGTGKTTILRLFTDKWKDKAELALIMTPRLSPDEFFRAILDDFKIPLSPSKNDMLKSFRDFLLTHAAQGKRVAIIIDEAQELPIETMEELRLLSNLETEKEKLLQIILIGQPELRTKLLSEPLRQLNQRITVRVHLNPLTESETSDYINTRLIRGGNSSLLYSQQAKNLIYKLSGGIPRTINLLASRGLMSAFLGETREVSGKHIEQGASDVLEQTTEKGGVKQSVPEKKPSSSRVRPETGAKPAGLRTPLLFAAALCAIAAFSTTLYLNYSKKTPATAVPPPVTAAKPIQKAVTSAVMAHTSSAKKAVVTPQPDKPLDKAAANAETNASALKSFNALATAWGFTPATTIAKPELSVAKNLEQLADKHDMNVSTFNGSLDKLVELDYPAIVAVGTTSTGKELYAALVKVSGDEFMLSPPPLGKKTLTRQEMEKAWHGKAFVLWKNSYNIPYQMHMGTRGKEASSVKLLLRNLSLPTGTSYAFAQQAVDSLKKFQRSQGIAATGQPDPQTLLRLYGKYNAISRPKLK